MTSLRQKVCDQISFSDHVSEADLPTPSQQNLNVLEDSSIWSRNRRRMQLNEVDCFYTIRLTNDLSPTFLSSQG
ncbi:hypothetical protein SESBI_15416 [Sesbania bispinosa]|nr:hypothetical protein SESBI_15416 [Sesbania bispinosa]